MGEVNKDMASRFEESIQNEINKIQDAIQNKTPHEKQDSSNFLTLKSYFDDYAMESSFFDSMNIIFDEIFSAFANSRYDVLKERLSPSLYDSFSEQIRKREEKNLRQDLSIEHISNEIKSVDVFPSNRVEITISFIVSQMSALVNDDGISPDNPNRLSMEVEHIWSFSREFQSDENSSPSNWILIKTSSVIK